MKRKDIWIIVAVLVIAVALFVIMPQGRSTLAKLFNEPAATSEPIVTPLAKIDSMIMAQTPVPWPTLRPAQSYVRVSIGGQVAALLPLIEDTTYPVKQADGKENIISIGHNSVSMHSSTCENQDCVQQGEITLENKDTRVLFNMVVCLPNQVSLELLTADEAQAAYEDMT